MFKRFAGHILANHIFQIVNDRICALDRDTEGDLGSLDKTPKCVRIRHFKGMAGGGAESTVDPDCEAFISIY